MTDVFSFHAGDSPLLISVPHDGCHLPADIRDRMTPAGLALPDTDWHVAELYGFARELGASMLVANYSRYVIDLNRPVSDEAMYSGQVATGLCPLQTFAGDDIYVSSAIDADEQQRRVTAYWQPYHDQITDVIKATREKYGYALLWDAHSISSVVPRLFDGELPELNLGTDGGRSCGREIEDAIVAAMDSSHYQSVLNGRFQGGFITRHYGDPRKHVHAVQLELAQRVYMDESTGMYDTAKASLLRYTLGTMLDEFVESAERLIS
jgi:N-formylglutamate amidohydrolase